MAAKASRGSGPTAPAPSPVLTHTATTLVLLKQDIHLGASVHPLPLPATFLPDLCVAHALTAFTLCCPLTSSLMPAGISPDLPRQPTASSCR